MKKVQHPTCIRNIKPFQNGKPAPRGRGGQQQAAVPRESRPPASISLYNTDLAQHAKDCDRYADTIIAKHPEFDDSPLSIKAAQNALEAHCKKLSEQQEKLSQEAEFFDEGEDYIRWDSMQESF